MRREQGISQQRLAEITRCSLSMIRILESGYEPERSSVLPRVLAALDGLNDAAPGAQAGREVTTFRRHGDGHAA